MGELRDVLARVLSSTNRAKTHWRGKKLKSRAPAVDAFARDEVRLVIACLVYQVMHIARRAMTTATGTGWSLRRLRKSCGAAHGWSSRAAGLRWRCPRRRRRSGSALWPRLMALHWADP